MPNIKDNLTALLTEIPSGVKLIVVSKMQPLMHIQEVYAAGQRRFGENRVGDLVAKQPVLPGDIEWHFIGHLQTNKVKLIAPFIHVIQSVDSLRLLREINKEAMSNDRMIDCMLQLYIATEETKFGLAFSEAKELLSSPGYRDLNNIRIVGVMGMATYTQDVSLVKKEFRMLKEYFRILLAEYFPLNPDFREISMGMSGDYRIAVESGSTMVRIGNAIFKMKNEE
ncbi:MAG: YggS family pyridoxal phosphate-dependent enzyme [Bacteroidetes bacterium]|nr:YggS family pyridoxal phosphate-dependent enzyme [Bacteroidota bacterium]